MRTPNRFDPPCKGSFDFSCLEVSALTPENLGRVCTFAQRYGIGAVAHMTGEWRNYQLLDHGEWGVPPADETARTRMRDMQAAIRNASEQVNAAGLDFFLWRRELSVPPGFVSAHGLDWINFDNPELWRFVRWNLETLFNLFPKVNGLFLTCTGEQKPREWITADGVGGTIPLDARFEKMFRTVLDTCRQHGRECIFRNHGDGEADVDESFADGGYMFHFMNALERVGEHVKIMGKGVESDFQPGYPFNQALTRMARRHPTLMEISLPMEYNGVSRVPFPMVEEIQYRLLQARRIQCHGVVARLDWHMSGHQTVRSWSCFGTLNEINAYAFGRLFQEPGLHPDAIRRDFAAERYGAAAAEPVARLLKHLYEAGLRKYYELGQRSSRTPSGAMLSPLNVLWSLRYNAPHLRSYAPRDFLYNQYALSPDHHFLGLVASEKEEAGRIYREALDALRDAESSLTDEDIGSWRSGLQRALEETTIRKHNALACYAWLAYEASGRTAFADEARTQVDLARPLADAYRKKYDENEYDPDVEYGFTFGHNTLDNLDLLEKEIRGSASYWAQAGDTGDNQRSGASKIYPGWFEMEHHDKRLLVNPSLNRCRQQTSGQEDPPVPCDVPLLRVCMGGLCIDQGTRLGFLRCRTYRDKDGDTLEFQFAFCDLTLRITSLATRDTLQLELCGQALPADARVTLPWHTGALVVRGAESRSREGKSY